MRFTLRQLEYFVATCEAGSVTDAALSIPVSQSSVSAAITQLEAALGVQLFIRHHAQGVSPTPAGRQFLAKARALLRQADELERFASELTKDLGGVLELGCLVTLAPLVMPPLCQAFRAQNPAVDFELVEVGQEDLLNRLRSGDLAVALTYDLGLAPDIHFERLVELPPYAVFATDDRLAARASVSFADLDGEPFVLLDLPHSREYFRSLFLAEGLEPNVAQRSTQPEVIRTLVANGYGFTIINARPRVDTSLDGRKLATVPIDGSPRPMVLGVATLAASRPTRLLTAFLEHCRRSVTPSSIPGIAVDGHR